VQRFWSRERFGGIGWQTRKSKVNIRVKKCWTVVWQARGRIKKKTEVQLQTNTAPNQTENKSKSA
jgi:hypothetical protein